MKEVQANKKAGIKTTIFVYYAGHGIMDTTTFAVCTKAPEEKKICYPLQDRLKTISNQGAYVCSIFDCCREKRKCALVPDPSSSSKREN